MTTLTATRPTARRLDRVTQVNGFTVYEYNVPTHEQLAQMWVAVAPLVAMLLIADEAQQKAESK